jgi:hypothetical protein
VVDNNGGNSACFVFCAGPQSRCSFHGGNCRLCFRPYQYFCKTYFGFADSAPEYIDELVAHLVSGFVVKDFFSAFLGSLIISFVSWLANSFIATHKIEKQKSSEYIDLEKGDDGKWR